MAIGVDIFSGAGGLSLGAEMAGIDVRLAVEKDKYAAATYRKNHPNTLLLEDDIYMIDPFKHLECLPKENIFIVFGGPPCQGFSVSNRKTRNLSNSNNTLYEEFIRFVNILKPRWFVFENVEGIVHFEKGIVLKKIRQKLSDLGYTISESILNAADYGVPQHRNRYIMVGNLLGLNFTYPKPLVSKITVREAIEDLPVLSNGATCDALPYRLNGSISDYAKRMRGDLMMASQNYVSKNADYVLERYKYIKQGQNWQAIPDLLMSNYSNKLNCHSGIYRRLEYDKPSVVISNYRKNMLIHPDQDRGLSVREAARIQSFPDSYKFEGTKSHIQQQIGNAVPPLLAFEIFKRIIYYEQTTME